MHYCLHEEPPVYHNDKVVASTEGMDDYDDLVVENEEIKAVQNQASLACKSNVP